MELGASCIGDHRDLADKGVHEKVVGDNRGIRSRENNIRTLYRLIAHGGVHYVTKVVGPRPCPQSDVDGGRVKEKTVSCVKKLSMSSFLGVCRKGEDLIHTSLYLTL